VDTPLLSPPQLRRYLGVLGVPAAQPSPAHLEALIRAQLTRVPFENVSKLLQRRAGQRGLPDLDTWLDGIERFRFGGTCYPNNSNLHRLLCSLGYDARLCGAEMSAPNVHMVVLVVVDGREFVGDVGYGAPFFEPMPRDLTADHMVTFGRDRFVLRPRSGDGRSRLDQYRDDERIHGYVVNPESRGIEQFADVIADSYSDSAAFMSSVVVVRFWPGRMVRLHNQTVIEAGPSKVTIRRLEHREQIPETAEHLFGIPAEMTARAIDGIGEWADIYA